MSIFSGLFGDQNKKALKKLESTSESVNKEEESIKKLSDEQLRSKTNEFKEKLNNGSSLDNILPEAFAVVRETAKRVLGERHYDVQITGGLIMHNGDISEMRTGEGKTLVATLPAYLNALEGKGVHIVTVNDYLARRDVVWMGQIFEFLGLTIGVINHEESFLYDKTHKELDKERDELGSFKVVHEFLRPCTRKEAYLADITYGTNNEFGFDYLRDNISYSEEMLVQRGYHFAIVDEIDSILIDEARTPLIISSVAQESENLYAIFANISTKLKKDEHYTIDEKRKAIQLTEEGIEKAENLLGVTNIYTEKGVKYVHHLETSVRAKALFEKDKDYVVKDGEVMIVDEFTGRLQPGRRWSEGLHQAIEAKEGVKVQKESKTVASITFQNYFRMYKKLSGMTGTAKTSAEEFYQVYGLEVLTVPTNKPITRIDHQDQIFQTEVGKFKAIARKVKELHENEQPVLIGTVSIEKNELLSAFLKKEGVPHQVLNAKQHENEGSIIAQAGRKGAVTIATNMAGRGVDIKLGGNPNTKEEYEEIKSIGGLFVVGTERHDARRIDNQLRGRSGRQGDSGATQFFVSLEDSLMRIFASDTIKNMMGRFGIPEDQPIENRLISKSLESAQTKIEGFNFDARKHVLEYDDVLNKQRSSVYGKREKLLKGNSEYVKEVVEKGKKDSEMKKIIEDKINSLGEKTFWENARRIGLQTIDLLWMEHLEMMDYMRSSVNLRAYGQRDPLLEYKKEGLRLFKEMGESIEGNIISMIPNMGAESVALRQANKIIESGKEAIKINQTDDNGEKVGRNDPCPCGSGKKYKKCCGV